jgi:hypothetical protein
MRVWLGDDKVRQPLEMSGAIDHLEIERPGDSQSAAAG